MNELNDLYQELILDHNAKPHNYGELKDAKHKAEGFNPLCGDRIFITLKIENGIVSGINFTGSGCAISKASTSLMTVMVKGKSINETNSIFKAFHDMLTADLYNEALLEKLVVFSGVKQFPMRVKCATLAWHTLMEALK